MTVLDVLVPDRALRWGRLTAEPYAWHEDRLRYVWRQAQREIAAPFVPIVEQVLRAVSVLSPDGHNSRDTGSSSAGAEQ